MKEECSGLADPGDKLSLIVEDDEGQLELLTHIVKTEGFRVEQAKDGGEALRKAAVLQLDIILLDLMLPGKAGYEVLRELQALGFGAIPVIVITARMMDAKTVDLIRGEPNVREFFSKPPQPAILGGTMHALLKTRPRNKPSP